MSVGTIGNRKERSIIMSTESVRAIFAGRKTQMRRVCKYPLEHNIMSLTDKNGFTKFLFDKWRPALYQVGDRLWVKETYRIHEYYDNVTPIRYLIQYKADYADDFSWENPMFMPRKYSRLMLEVTSVDLEPLHDIKIEDAMAGGYPLSKKIARKSLFKDKYMPNAIIWYQRLWDAINSNCGFSWNNNPWVWVITFRIIEKEANDWQMTGK